MDELRVDPYHRHTHDALTVVAVVLGLMTMCLLSVVCGMLIFWY